MNEGLQLIVFLGLSFIGLVLIYLYAMHSNKNDFMKAKKSIPRKNKISIYSMETGKLIKELNCSENTIIISEPLNAASIEKLLAGYANSDRKEIIEIETMDYKELLKKYIIEVDSIEGINPESIFNINAKWDNIKEGDITKEEALELIKLYKS